MPGLVQHFVTPWTVAHQPPLPWDSPGKNTGVGCLFLLQGIFLTQGLNPNLLDWQVDSLPPETPGKCPQIIVTCSIICSNLSPQRSLQNNLDIKCQW